MPADIFAPAPAARSFASAAQERLLNGSPEGARQGAREGVPERSQHGVHKVSRDPAAEPTHTGLHTPAVRDLAWLMTSAPLLSRAAFGTQLADPFDETIFGHDARQRMHRFLQRLDKAPQPLIEALASTDERRLGRYAERLLTVWLTQSDDIALTASGLPVRDMQAGGRTLGECDALFRTALGSRQHWELAVKFFLFIDDDCPAAQVAKSTSTASHDDRLDTLLAGCDAYVGAGLADRFDWKLRRLIAHQLPLSAQPALLAMAPGPWQASMFVKGRLFYPLAQWRDPLMASDGSLEGRRNSVSGDRAPTAIADDHPRGWWATLDTWLSWSEASACRWTSLARLDWLAPLRVHADRTRDVHAFAEAMRAHFASGLPSASMPRQVAAVCPASAASSVPETSTGAMHMEMSRGFIVPNEWPERARRFRRSGL